MAAADIMGVRSMHLDEEQEQPKAPPKQEPPTPEEAWIKTNENWV